MCELILKKRQHPNTIQILWIVKKHIRTNPDVQFKEISLTKKKTRPRKDYEWIRKTISKKLNQKKKNRKPMSKCRMWKKHHKREMEIWLKHKSSPRMHYKWIGKTIQKRSKHTVKIKMKLPHVNKTPLARKRIFLERKTSRRKTTRFFAPIPVSAWPKSLLLFDFKNHEKPRCPQ